jgi:hypothetical protein
MAFFISRASPHYRYNGAVSFIITLDSFIVVCHEGNIIYNDWGRETLIDSFQLGMIAAIDFYSRLFGLFYRGLATLAGYFSILGGRFILYCSENLLACFKINYLNHTNNSRTRYLTYCQDLYLSFHCFQRTIAASSSFAARRRCLRASSAITGRARFKKMQLAAFS